VIAVLTANARRDLVSILSTSRAQFGEVVQHKYRLLLEQAVADLAADPSRRGVRQSPGVADDVWIYHSRFAAARTPGKGRISRPRHVLAFQLRGETVVILRILHDAMDFPRHLGGV
jgi:toxin ParE1/3/4